MAIIPKESLIVESPNEEVRVFGWRVKCLMRAGYDFEAAWLIGNRTDVDLHHAVNLLKQGCTVDTALLILL